VVTTETPARRRSIVIFPLIPRPPAAFSPFTTTKSIPYCSFSFGKQAITASRPGWPTMSPRKSAVSIEQDRIEQVQNVDANPSTRCRLLVNILFAADLRSRGGRNRQSRHSRKQAEVGRARALSTHHHA